MTPKFRVVKTLHQSRFKCELILFESRPGFWVPGSIWTPATLNPNQTAPGILLTSGHSPDGWRSNNVGGDVRSNAPTDDDYEIVQMDLVARGYVVLAFDPSRKRIAK